MPERGWPYSQPRNEVGKEAAYHAAGDLVTDSGWLAGGNIFGLMTGNPINMLPPVSPPSFVQWSIY